MLVARSRLQAASPSIRRMILIADRGLLSLDNLAALSALRLADDQPLEFILAVPRRRYYEFTDLLQPFHHAQGQGTQETVGEVRWNGHRLVVAHDPVRAAEQSRQRHKKVQTLIDQGEQWAGQLGDQEQGLKHRGRKLSDSGAKARLYHAVSEAHLSKIIRVALKSDLFTYEIDDQVLISTQYWPGAGHATGQRMVVSG